VHPAKPGTDQPGQAYGAAESNEEAGLSVGALFFS